MTPRNTPRRPLTELQQAILDIVWARRTATADDIRHALRARYALKDSTVRTLLRRLEARGYLTHRLDGNTFVYRAQVARNGVAARAVRQIIDRLCAGSVEQFLVGMVDEKVLSLAELERLARKVRQQK